MNVCTYCSSPDHELSRCPWKDAMKRTIAALAVAALLSGCAGLSVNFGAVITYRSDVPAGERKP